MGDPDRTRSRADEEEDERLDRELLEALNELRVLMPGVQVLFAFLLAAPFQQRFERATSFQHDLYLVTLLAAAIATAVFIAPVAFHRIQFRNRDKPALVKAANSALLVGLAFLGVSMLCAITLVTDVIFRRTTVIAVAAPTAVLFVALWFLLGWTRRLRGGRSW